MKTYPSQLSKPTAGQLPQYHLKAISDRQFCYPIFNCIRCTSEWRHQTRILLRLYNLAVMKTSVAFAPGKVYCIASRKESCISNCLAPVVVDKLVDS